MENMVKSELLGIDVPIDVCSDDKNPEGELFIIKHATIEKILMENPRIKVARKPVVLRPEMCVVECTATDEETGASTFAVGESNPRNLDRTISKQYPATIAYQRAEDRAVIALLGLPQKKVYSTLEIENAKSVDSSLGNGTVEELPFETAESPSAKNAPATTVPVAPTDEYEVKMEQPPATKNIPEANSQSSISDDTVILFGNCKGKTFGEVKNSDDFKLFMRFCSKNSPRFNDERAAQAELFNKMAKDMFAQEGVA